MKKELIVPEFKNDDEEFEFWSNLDLSEYADPKDLVPVSFPNLKPTKGVHSKEDSEELIKMNRR